MEKFSSHPAHLQILGSMEFGKTRNYYFKVNWGGGVNLKLKKVYAEKFSKTTGI